MPHPTHRRLTRASPPRVAALALVAAAVAVGLGATLQRARADTPGPDFCRADFTSSIKAVGAGDVDVDDYVGTLATGERLSVVVRTARGSGLRPDLRLFSPSSGWSPVIVQHSRRGRSARIRGFPVPTQEQWTVRVAGLDGSEGKYTVRFRVRDARPTRSTTVSKDGGVQLHAFEAVGDSRLDVRVVPAAPPVGIALALIRDPLGRDVAIDPKRVRTHGRSGVIVLRDQPLTDLAGPYTLGVRAEPGDGYHLRLRVTRREGTHDRRDGDTPPRRRRSVRRLDPAEPRIHAMASATDTVPGADIVFSGMNFSTKPETVVSVGGLAATVRVLTENSCTVIAPACPPGTSQSITLVNPDGQASTSADHVYFVREPAFAATTPYAPAVVGLSAGETVLVSGTGFSSGDTILIDDVPATTTFVSESTLRFVTPSLAEGGHAVQVRDSFGRVVAGPALFAATPPHTLVPGGGFSGTTPQPPVQGSGAGSDAKAIARWDVVPFQEFSGTMTIGVVAFHINDIDRVEFSAEGGAWTAVRELTLNARTGVWEYQVALDPTDFTDGPVEVRAIAYPTVGVPRVLAGDFGTEFAAPTLANGEHSMFLVANAGGALPSPARWVDAASGSDVAGDGSPSNPFRSLQAAAQSLRDANGATIHCGAGTYAWGPATSPSPYTRDRWLTIQPAAGVDRTAVTITSGPGFKTNLIRARSVTMTGFFGTSSGGFRGLWLDGVECRGPGFSTTATQAYHASNWSGIWITNSLVRDHTDGTKGALLVRNTQLRNLTSDAFSDSRMVLNCAVDGINGSGTDFHSDVYQFSGSGVRDNTIICGLEAINVIAQGLFSDNVSNVNNTAIVNVLIAKDAAATGFLMGQWSVPMDHLLMRGVTVARMNHAWRDKHQVGAPYMNIRVEGCVFQSLTNFEGVVLQNDWFASCHYIDGTLSPGSDASTGDAGFVNATEDDFRATPGSPLRSRLPRRLFPVDVDGNDRAEPDTVGAAR